MNRNKIYRFEIDKKMKGGIRLNRFELTRLRKLKNRLSSAFLLTSLIYFLIWLFSPFIRSRAGSPMLYFELGYFYSLLYYSVFLFLLTGISYYFIVWRIKVDINRLVKFEGRGKVEKLNLNSKGGSFSLRNGQKLYVVEEFRLKQKIRKGDVIIFSYLKKSRCIIELLSVER